VPNQLPDTHRTGYTYAPATPCRKVVIMSKLVAAAAIALIAGAAAVSAQQTVPAAQPTRFAGTWVGTQSWAIANPPPGSRPDQPVTLTLEVSEGKITGTLKPFLGGEDGATIVDATIVGDELQATAVVGRPRPGGVALPPPGNQQATTDSANPPPAGGRGGAPRGWKDSTRVLFKFRNEGLQGLNLVGTADVTMSDVPWMKFKYELSKKRSRY
jgi:hypothetical protein